MNDTVYRHRHMRAAYAALIGSTMLAGAHPALAQGPAPAVTTVDNGEIVVTAQKRSESIQKVPISIQALTSATLEQHQVQSFDDYVKLLPSVSFQTFGPGQSQLYFRGISTGGDGLQSGPLPTAGVYIDEVPVTTIANTVDIHVYDIARVEALSGPQGTLYGASSLAGTLRLITNKPSTKKFEAGYDLELNKFGKGNVGGTAEGFVNVPISSTAAVRLVGFYEKDGGFIDNTFANRTYLRPNTSSGLVDEDNHPIVTNAPLTINNGKFAKKNFNDVETYGGRAALKIDLDDSWTVTPAVIYQHQVANGTFLYDPRAGDLEVHDFTPDQNRDQFYLASMTVQGKISDWDLTYAASQFGRTVDNTQDYSYFNVAYDSTYTDYNYYKDALGNDIDPTQTFHSHDRFTKMSHELRVNSPADNRFRVTAGLFYQRQTNRHVADYILPGLPNAVNPYSPPVGEPYDVFYTNIHRVDRDYAAFGEASFDILPHLTATAGIRGFIARNSLDGFSGGSGTVTRQIELFGCTGTTAQQCPNIDKKYKENGETHKANLTWQVDRDRMVYATYSTGFRPGGNNRDAFANNQLQSFPPFKADTITNYELGWKTSWLDRTLRINGALFWEDWSKVQYSQPGLLGIYYTVNAGTARSRGVEGDINWTLQHHLTLSAAGTYVDARLTKAFVGTNEAGNPVVLAPKGTRLPVQPRFKIAGTARYDFDLGPKRAFLQGTVNHQGGTTSYLTTDGEALLGPTKQFTTFDFSAGLSFNKMSVQFFIQNAFDKRGILSKNSVCTPGICGAYARLYPVKPQLFGVKVGQRF
ncbi:MAG: TonB-dependent receptor [Sphingomicrobium sp.]